MNNGFDELMDLDDAGAEFFDESRSSWGRPAPKACKLEQYGHIY